MKTHRSSEESGRSWVQIPPGAFFNENKQNKFMMKLFGIFIFLLFLPIAFAINFEADITPTTINATRLNIVNFTINNTDPIRNITILNITLPPEFNYIAGTYGTTAENAHFSPIPSPSWSNTTPQGFVAKGTVEYFWIGVEPGNIGTFNFNLTVTDDLGNKNSTLVSVNVVHIDAPMWSDNTTSPISPATYGQLIHFNITWSDNIALSHVIFELIKQLIILLV